MKYDKTVPAVFLERPNRFVARCLVEGEEKQVHVKNTGRCKEILPQGAKVFLEDFRHKMGTRKMEFSLVTVEKSTDRGAFLVNMDSQAPNKLVKEALEDGRIILPGMEKLCCIRPEKTYGDSRFDFYVEDEKGQRGFIEVKGVTLEEDALSSFPDAPTERGAKHVRELVKAKVEGYKAYIIFVLQMAGMKEMRPNDSHDPNFGKALREAHKAGVEVLAYECEVGEDFAEIRGSVPVNLALSK